MRQGKGHGAYSLALERSPNNGFISNRELGQTASWENLAFRDVEGIENGDYIVAASACSFDISYKLPSHQLVHVPAKERRVQGDLSLEVVKEEHVGRDDTENWMLGVYILKRLQL